MSKNPQLEMSSVCNNNKIPTGDPQWMGMKMGHHLQGDATRILRSGVSWLHIQVVLVGAQLATPEVAGWNVVVWGRCFLFFFKRWEKHMFFFFWFLGAFLVFMQLHKDEHEKKVAAKMEAYHEWIRFWIPKQTFVQEAVELFRGTFECHIIN